MADMQMDNSLVEQTRVINENRAFIVEHLEAEDVIDELIQERLMGRSAGQRVQLPGLSREEKNRIICEQLTTAGPDAVNKFCKILRDNRRQSFIAERLDKSLHSATTQCTSVPPTVKSSPIDVKRIKARYIRQPPTSKTDWPKHRVTQYVRLALVDKEDVTIRDKNLNEITKLSIQGEVDKILKKKQPLGDLKDIFNNPCPRLILIMGAPGIGKTTLANEICVKWARGGFLAEQFDIVLSIPLRSANDRSVEEVMVEHVGGVEAYEHMKKSAGERCLIILEGLDEVSIERQRSDKFLVRVIQSCTLLEEAKLVITSRPHACEKINADRTVEIIGFGTKEIRQFVEKSFTDGNTVEEFLVQLNEYPHIRSLCYIPINLVMIVDIFQVNKKLPSTLTELYKLFIIMTIQRQLKKKGEEPSCLPAALPAATEEVCKLLNGIPKDAVRTVFVLSRLAYCGFFHWHSDVKNYFGGTFKDPKIIFTTEDLTQCGIEVTADWDGYGLLKATPTHDVPVDIITYNFSHLTIQDFMCALNISTLSDQEQQRLLNEHFGDYPNVFMYYYGLSKFMSPATSQFVFEKLKSNSETDVLSAIRCLYESKVTAAPQSATPCEMDLSGTTLLPYDILCIGHVVSFYPIVELSMRRCQIGDNDANLLEKHYSGHVLQELHLWGNDLTVTGVGYVMKLVMKSSATLRVLNVDANPFGDDGISLMVDHLYHNTTLNELNVELCKLSAKGASCVGRYLKNCNLQVLNIGNNPIGDDGISVMMDGLQRNKTLTKLDVHYCGLSAKGASCIGECLKENCTLKVLNMSWNDIGDVGISQLMKGLHQNTSLTELDVSLCGLSVKGASCIGECLKKNCTLKVLNMSENDIGDVGISQLMKGLHQNTSLTELRVSRCGLSAKGGRCVGELLQVNTSLEVLWIGFNDIGDDGVAVIAGALGKSRIRVLNLYECGITVTGAKELATVLSVNQSIKKLEIHVNVITVEGARLVLQSAVNNNVCEEVDVDYEYQRDSEVEMMMKILEARREAKNNSRSTDDRGQEDKELVQVIDSKSRSANVMT